MSNTVLQAKLELIEVYDGARKAMRRDLVDYMTEDEKLLRSNAFAIDLALSRARSQARDEADAIIRAEGIQYPAPYQVLLDEITPLREMKSAQDRTSEILSDIKNNTRDWGEHIAILAEDLREECKSWKGEYNTVTNRIYVLESQMDHKTRRGSKVQQAYGARMGRLQVLRTEKEMDAERKLFRAHPDWKDILEQEKSLMQTAEVRRDADVASFREPIKQALENLACAVAQAIGK